MILHLDINFTTQEIIRFFRKHSFEVKQSDVRRYDRNTELVHSEWMVCNPSTGEWVELDDAFRKVAESRQTELFLDGHNRLNIINTLNN
ncbi:hypothetical protein FACS1894199_11400 [Bacteroidia bacterium]|nr:hypothetical protein FACS1894199_11400 [Bacteroidia bacterium]